MFSSKSSRYIGIDVFEALRTLYLGSRYLIRVFLWSAYRIVMEVAVCTSFLLSCLLVYRDDKRLIRSSRDWVAGRVFRHAALWTSFMYIINHVDYLGVFGIYPVGVRAMFKTLLMLSLSSAVYTYVYFCAKACFPFVLYVREQWFYQCWFQRVSGSTCKCFSMSAFLSIVGFLWQPISNLMFHATSESIKWMDGMRGETFEAEIQNQSFRFSKTKAK